MFVSYYWVSSERWSAFSNIINQPEVLGYPVRLFLTKTSLPPLTRTSLAVYIVCEILSVVTKDPASYNGYRTGKNLTISSCL
jgi:hypothetical protein